ncbi:MAG: hypothetical protein ABSC05_16940 [Candidatus Solibacter sp.]
MSSRLLREDTVDLAPERTWTLEIADPPQSHLTFELSDAAGRPLMRQTDGEYDWTPEALIRTGPQPRPPRRTARTRRRSGTQRQPAGILVFAY